MARALLNGLASHFENIVNHFIVDTSVWIDFFRGHLPDQILGYLNEGICLKAVMITDGILHEILVGAQSKNHFQELVNLFSPLNCLRIRDFELAAFNQFAWEVQRKGFKGSYTDVSIAFVCFQNRCPLLTFDRYFHALDKNLRRDRVRIISCRRSRKKEILLYEKSIKEAKNS